MNETMAVSCTQELEESESCVVQQPVDAIDMTRSIEAIAAIILFHIIPQITEFEK